MVSNPNRDKPLQDEMYRMEQLKAKEQLFSSIQFLTDLVQMIPSKRLQHESHGGDVELREGSPGLHEMPGVPGLLELEPDSTPLPLQNRQGKKKGYTFSWLKCVQLRNGSLWRHTLLQRPGEKDAERSDLLLTLHTGIEGNTIWWSFWKVWGFRICRCRWNAAGGAISISTSSSGNRTRPSNASGLEGEDRF